MKEININTDIIKLDQFLKWAGVADTGAFAKELILSGSVKVNGEVVLQRGRKLYRGFIISVDNYGEFKIV